MPGNDDKELEKIVLTHMVRLNAFVSGAVLGIIFGSTLFLVTNLLILKGGEVIGPHLALLGQLFIGYTVTFTGSLIGWVYGFVVGFGIGYSVAMLYNWLLNLRNR